MTRVYQAIGNFPSNRRSCGTHSARVSDDRSTASHRREDRSRESRRVFGVKQTQSSLPAGVPVNLRRPKVASPRLRGPYCVNIRKHTSKHPFNGAGGGALNDFSQKQKLDARVCEPPGSSAFCCVSGVLPWPSRWEFCCSCCCCCLLANFFI